MSNLPIHEKIKKFAEAAENLLDEISPEELTELSKDIESSAENIWQYVQLLEADATRLSNIAMLHAETAAKQKKKAARLKDYLKFALKSNGFSKLKAGAIQMSLVERRKAFAKRPALDTDFFASPDFMSVKFAWKSEPTMLTWQDLPEFVIPEFTWDVKKLKAAGKEGMLDYEITDALTVGISKED